MPTTIAPDIDTKFNIKDSSSFNGYARYRVTGWLKAVPLRYEKYIGKGEAGAEIIDEILSECFYEEHPDWNHEYKLVHCTRNEATHVEGYGVCGIIVAINDERVNFEHIYVNWSEEIINERRDSFIRMIEFRNQFLA